jgi:hypothetical protein
MRPQKIIQLAMLSIGLFSGCGKDTGVTPTTTTSETSVVTYAPSNNALSIARNASVSATFNEAMDPSSINTSTFLVMNDTAKVIGIVTYTGVTATFTPTSILKSLTKYTVSVTTGAKNLAGKSLAKTTTWSFTTSGNVGLAAVDLGASINYVILAKTAINNNPTSNITGDLGLSPAAASYITGLSLIKATGYALSSQVTGKIYAADMADPTPINLTTSVNNMMTAYTDAAGRPSPDFTELGTGNIGGKTLSPGLYKWSSTVSAPTSLTISGGANDVWIFQIAGNLTISSAVNITLSGGAQAKNIFWQVAGDVTIGTTSHFEGVILSKTSITLKTGASLKGRALAQTAVILDGNAVTQP